MDKPLIATIIEAKTECRDNILVRVRIDGARVEPSSCGSTAVVGPLVLLKEGDSAEERDRKRASAFRMALRDTRAAEERRRGE